MGAKVDLVDRTVENTGTSDLTLKEYIEKVSTIAAGVKVDLDPNTKMIEF